MASHELEIEITPTGEVKAHVKGVKGPGCMEYVKLLQEILGSSGDVTRTSEYYEDPPNVEEKIEQTEQ